jgi:Tol biopolymer transport system component/subtilisin family serine protease
MTNLQEVIVKRSAGVRLLGIIGVLVLLLLSSYGTIPVGADGNDASDTGSINVNADGSKVSSILSLHIKLKQIQSAEFSQTVMKPLRLDQQSTEETTLVDNERVFLHFTQPPSADQINDLSLLGVNVYPDSWIPPVGNFNTGFVLADMPVYKLDSLTSKSYIVSLDTAEQTLSLQNDQARAAMNVNPVWTSGYNGTGVTVAVIDSGIDTSNRDFPTLNSSNSKDYSNYPTLDDSITNSVTGHGTHVAGSLLGRGVNGAAYMGVAPGANLVFLKVGNDTTGSAKSDAVTYAIRDAVDVYHAKIINLSIGSFSEYHDGSDQTCQAVDYATSQGAAVFVAAGNEASKGWHFSSTISKTNPIGTMITIGQGATSYLSLNLVWYSGSNTQNNFSLQYLDPDHKPLAFTSSVQSTSTRGVSSIQYQLNSPVPSGTYYINMQNSSPDNQFFHLYYMGASSSVAFYNPDPNYTIDAPAEADSAIAVGAYVTRKNWTNYQGHGYYYNPQETVGSIASYSSYGPRIDAGAPPKPEILAPGSAIISVRDSIYALGGSVGSVPNDPGIIDNDGQVLNGSGPANYFIMQGTSTASPIAAGAGAMLLSKNPSLTPSQIAHTLEATASNNGTFGNNANGWGLINVAAAINYSVSLNSYSNTSHATLCQNFNDSASQRTVYLYGSGYLKSRPYRIIYFDGSNKQVVNAIVTSSDTGTLFSLHTFTMGNDVAGAWHAIVSEPQFNFTGAYSAGYSGYVAASTFNVSYLVILPLTVGKIIFNSDEAEYWNNQIWVINSDGTGERQLTHDTAGDFAPVWSPDGKKIAFVQLIPPGQGSNSEGTDIFCVDADGSNLIRLTNFDSSIGYPRWSPDGSKIAFVWNNSICIMNADGSHQSTLATGNGPTWSPDSSKLMYIGYINGYSYLCEMNADGSGKKQLLTSQFLGNNPSWSPDGTMVAYLSGNTQISVMNSDGTNQRQITNTPIGKSCLTWSPDSNRIAYMSIYNTSSGPPGRIYIINSDGTNETQLTNDSINRCNPCWLLASLNNLVFKTSSQTVTAGLATSSIVVQTRDTSGNPINVPDDTTINLTSSSISGEFSTNNSVWTNITEVTIPTGNNSVSFYYKDTAAGTPIITISNSNYKAANQQEIIQAAAANQIRVETVANGSGAIVPNQNIAAGNSITVYSVSRDQFGNFISNSPGTWSLVNKTGNVTNSDLIPSGDNKSAIFTGHLTGTAGVHVTANGLNSINSGTLTIIPGEATKFSVTGYPSAVSAGSANSFTVSAQNNFGNASYTGTVHFTSNDPQADLPSNYTFTSDDNGVHVFQATLKSAGTRSITATDIVKPGITGSQNNIIVSPLTASQVRAESAANGSGITLPNQNLSLGFSLAAYGVTRDQYGNYVGNPSNTIWSLDNKTGGIADSDLNGTNGASIIFTGHQVGTCILNASITGLSSVKSGIINVIVPPPAPVGGGGGGGGGGEVISQYKIVLVNGLSAKGDFKVSSTGVLQNAVQLTTADGKATLDIAQGTKLLRDRFDPVTVITASVPTTPEKVPEGCSLVLAYFFGPDGANFNPGLTLKMAYDPAGLPKNVAEKDLFIAYYDGTQWQKIESIVDTDKKIVSGKIIHFSNYALLGQETLTTTPVPSASTAPSPISSPSPLPSPSPSTISDIRPTSTPGAELTPIAANTATPIGQSSPTQTINSNPSPKVSPQFNFTILIIVIAAVVMILGMLIITLRIRKR